MINENRMNDNSTYEAATDDGTEYSAADGGMDWDEALEYDGTELIILPEGDYVFQVTELERGRFPGSAKIPPCNKASLTLQVETPEGTARIRTDLLLHRSLEWKLSSFFRCIGQKQKGQRLVMNWNSVTGARGRAHFKPRTYTASDGTERAVNDVERYLDYDEALMPPLNPAGFTEPAGGADAELPF